MLIFVVHFTPNLISLTLTHYHNDEKHTRIICIRHTHSVRPSHGRSPLRLLLLMRGAERRRTAQSTAIDCRLPQTAVV